MEVSNGNLSEDSKIVSKFYTEANFKTNKEINVKLDGEVYKGSEFKIDKSKVLVHFYVY
jgi:diacylglycerol kinase family enzyme